MSFSPETNKLLSAPLDASRVQEREGGGNRMLSYLATWDVIDRANKVFGFDGWSRETVSLTEEHMGTVVRPGYNGKKDETRNVCVYVARVRITVWDGERAIIRDGVGYGDGEDKRIGAAIELAVKEAESDATKRALSTFGYGFGLALYDKTQAHVEEGVDERVDAEREPERQPEKKPEPKPAPRPAGRVVTKPPAEKSEPERKADPATKHFPAPRVQTPEEWQVWSRQMAVAIKASPNRMRATDLIAANVKELKQCGAALERDAREWAEGLINKRFANTPAKEESREL